MDPGQDTGKNPILIGRVPLKQVVHEIWIYPGQTLPAKVKSRSISPDSQWLRNRWCIMLRNSKGWRLLNYGSKEYMYTAALQYVRGRNGTVLNEMDFPAGAPVTLDAAIADIVDRLAAYNAQNFAKLKAGLVELDKALAQMKLLQQIRDSYAKRLRDQFTVGGKVVGIEYEDREE